MILTREMEKKIGLLMLAASFETTVCLLIQLLWITPWSVCLCGIFLGKLTIEPIKKMTSFNTNDQ